MDFGTAFAWTRLMGSRSTAHPCAAESTVRITVQKAAAFARSLQSPRSNPTCEEAALSMLRRAKQDASLAHTPRKQARFNAPMGASTLERPSLTRIVHDAAARNDRFGRD